MKKKKEVEGVDNIPMAMLDTVRIEIKPGVFVHKNRKTINMTFEEKMKVMEPGWLGPLFDFLIEFDRLVNKDKACFPRKVDKIGRDQEL